MTVKHVEDRLRRAAASARSPEHSQDGLVTRFLVNRDFSRLWLGQAVSSVGDFVFDTTLTLWIATVLLAGSHWAPEAVSGLMLCAFAVTVLVGPASGVFVDRWSKRRTMLASEAVRAILVGLLAILTLLPRRDISVAGWLAMIYLIVIVINSAGQLFNPARVATIGEIVPDEVGRTKAFGLGQATAAGAAIIGPPLAAPLLFALGIQWAIFLNCLSYIISFLAIRSVRFPATSIPRADADAPVTERPRWRRQFSDGLKMFARNRYLMAMLCTAVLSSLGTGSITSLLVFFLRDNLHVTANLLGIMWMAYGAGAVVGGLASGFFARLLSARTVTWLGLLLGGATFLIYSRQTEFAVAVVLMFIMAMPVAVMNAALGPQLLAVTPKEFTGRMFAVLTPAMTAASMLSVVLAGTLASSVLTNFHARVLGVAIGPIDLLFSVSALLVVAAGVVAYLTLPRPSHQRASAARQSARSR